MSSKINGYNVIHKKAHVHVFAFNVFIYTVSKQTSLNDKYCKIYFDKINECTCMYY